MTTAFVPHISEAELDRQLDRKPLDPLQWRVLLLIAAALMLEGIDIQLLGFAAPSMAAQWGLPKGALGFAMAAALIGMVIGSPLGGRLGDRFGRRPVLVACILLFGVLTLTMALAGSIAQIAALRLGAGLGFGAALSNAPTLIAEWMPSRQRNQTITLALIGIPCGGMLGAAAASWVIPAFGWRTGFALGGGLPILLACAMFRYLPESPRFFNARLARPEKLLELLSTLKNMDGVTRNLAPVQQLAVDAGPAEESPLKTPYTRSTFGLSLAFLASLAISYAFFSWTATWLSGLGMSLQTALRGAFFFNLFGVVGALLSAPMVARIGSRFGLLWLCALGVLATCGTIFAMKSFETSGPAAGDSALLLLGIGVIGIAAVAGQVALFGAAIYAYPTSCRATGLGIAGCAGRLGGILSAFAGGTVLSLASGSTLFLVLIALLFALCAVGVLIVDRHAAAGQ